MSNVDRKTELAKEISGRQKIPMAEAMKQVDEIFKEGGESKRDQMLKDLGVKTELLKSLGKATSGMDPNLKALLTTETMGDFKNLGAAGEEDYFEKDLKSVLRQMQRLKMLDVIGGRFGDDKPPAGIKPEDLAKAMAKEMKGITDTVIDLQKSIEGKEKSEMWHMVEEIKKAVGGGPDGAGASDPIKKINEAKEFVTSMKGVLEESGFKVEPGYITKDQLPSALTDMNVEEVTKILEAKGYKITGKPIPYDQHETSIREAVEKAKLDTQDDKNTERIAGMVETVTDNFFTKVLGPLMMQQANAPEPGQEGGSAAQGGKETSTITVEEASVESAPAAGAESDSQNAS